MATWNLEPTRETVHGVFSREFEPILTVDSGDTIHYKTLEAGWGLEPRDPSSQKPGHRTFDDFIPERRGDGHCLIGPVAMRGAEPGMTLEVRIDEVRVGKWGWTGCFPGPIAQGAGVGEGEAAYLAWELDADRKRGRNQFGHEVELRPFMGVMGMPPDEPGMHSTIPPRRTAGNIDCKELVPGTSLFLPIEVAGGLLSIGDGHAAQGDGEVSGTAIECPMERATVTLILHKNIDLKSPRARIDGAWLTFGFHDDLNQAAFLAVEDMVSLIVDVHGLDRAAALALASVTVDLRITQYVNRVKGVHACLRDECITK